MTEKLRMKENRFKFENLLFWQKAMIFCEDINLLSDKFPKKELYNHSSRMSRSVGSITLNISEESIGRSNPDFKKIMSNSIRSSSEVVTCLRKAKRRNYMSEQEFEKYYDESYHLMNMMIANRKKIN